MNIEKNKKIDINLKEKRILNKLLNRFKIHKNTVLIIIFLLIIMVVLNLLWTKPSKKYQILYDHLSNDDREEIISQLIHMNVPYRFNEQSGMLLVPENQVYDIRFQLAEQNLPKASGIGFELLDQEKFGTSQFNEQINYQRALEGELSRTIERLQIIKQAKVHIALPQSSLFIRDKKEPTASVILILKPAQYLNREQVNAILHLISRSVSGLKTNHITIIDQSGKLLNNINDLHNEFNDMQFKYSESIEKHYKKHIEDILSPILGLDNIHAQVTVQIDFNNQEKMEEKFAPNVNLSHQAIRSHQSSDKIDIDEKNIDGSVSHVVNDYVKNKSKTPISNVKNINNQKKNRSYILTQSQKHHDNTINYELDHTLLHKKIKTGEIKRLSAAVVVNFIKDNNGNFIPLNVKQIDQIKELTCNAIGYSQNRGDSVNVVNALFVKDAEKKISDKIVVSSKIKNLIDQKNVNHSKTNFVKFNIFQKINIILFIFGIILTLLFFVFFQFFIFNKLLKKQKLLYLKNQHNKSKSQENVSITCITKNSKNTKLNENKQSQNQSIDIIKTIKQWISEDKI